MSVHMLTLSNRCHFFNQFSLSPSFPQTLKYGWEGNRGVGGEGARAGEVRNQFRRKLKNNVGNYIVLQPMTNIKKIKAPQQKDF